MQRQVRQLAERPRSGAVRAVHLRGATSRPIPPRAGTPHRSLVGCEGSAPLRSARHGTRRVAVGGEQRVRLLRTSPASPAALLSRARHLQPRTAVPAEPSLFIWLVAHGWCCFVLTEKYYCLIAGG